MKAGSPGFWRILVTADVVLRLEEQAQPRLRDAVQGLAVPLIRDHVGEPEKLCDVRKGVEGGVLGEVGRWEPGV